MASALSLPAANIAWVSYHSADNTPTAAAITAGLTNAADVGYTALLTANGHKVTRFVTVEGVQNYPDTIAALNTNQLVIISRCVPSGHYDSVEEAAAWNGLTVPLMALGGYANRAVRLGFHTADTIPDNNVFPMRLKVNAPAHPIFAGVSLTNGMMVNPYSQRAIFTNTITGATTNQTGISVVTSPLVAGGSALAIVGTAGDAALNGMVIGEFPAGITSQRGSVFAAKRLVFLTGSRESGITGEASGLFDLAADGQRLFLNAVTYMITPQVPKCTLPLTSATNLMPGDSWTFSAGPLGDQPITYQWYRNNQPLATGTTAALALTNMTSFDGGDYYLIIANSLGKATSTVGRLDFAVLPAANLTNGIISYWPLDTTLGNKTPDLVSGYDMTMVNMGATNLVDGKFGKCFQFDNAAQKMLQRINNPGEDLPIYNKTNFTVACWVNGPVQTDRRVFAEGYTGSTSPMFDFGTHNGGTDGTIDSYIRGDSGATVGDHRHSTGIAFDSTWHHITYVQRDLGYGQMIGVLYIDGVRDPVSLTPVRPMTLNTTAIGGLLRASASAWFTGMMDEVVVWERALTDTEIGMLQTSKIVNPPSRLQPLAINSFKADLPTVAKGGSTVLRWDVSKDASQITIDQIGDVTASTSVGAGTNAVTLTTSTTYVMTAKRGLDTVTASTTVTVIDGVNAGWTLLDNFDRYSLGQLHGTGYWTDPHGNSAQIIEINGNKALKTTTADSVTFLALQSLTVKEMQACTLFFRIILTNETPSGITNIVGLTDKSQRGYADSYTNVGPVLYLNLYTNDVYGATTNSWYMGARDFPGGGVQYPEQPLQTNVVYNVWMNITNNGPMAEYAYDQFSVYIQKLGESSRTLVFNGFSSDRNPDPGMVDPVLGAMMPNLDKLIVLGNNATYGAVFDDFYLSKGAYIATVPRAYGYTGPVGPLPALQIGWSGSQVQIRWTTGTLQEAATISGPWTDVSGAAPPSYSVAPSGFSKFYRARP